MLALVFVMGCDSIYDFESWKRQCRAAGGHVVAAQDGPICVRAMDVPRVTPEAVP